MSGTVNQVGGLPLFAPRSHRQDPATSRDAADSMISAAKTQRLKVLRALMDHGPMTAFEINDLFGWDYATASRRLPELEEGGLVRKTEEVRATRSGRTATVWKATGRAFFDHGLSFSR